MNNLLQLNIEDGLHMLARLPFYSNMVDIHSIDLTVSRMETGVSRLM